MQKFEDSLNQLELLVSKFMKEQKKMKEEIKNLKEEISLVNDKNLLLTKQNAILTEQNKKIKIVSAISGNEEYKKLMKLKINKLIKELDTCIVKVKNS